MSDSGTHVWAKFYYWDQKAPPVQLSVTLAVETSAPNILIGHAKALAMEAISQGLYVDYPTGEEELEPDQALCEADSAMRRHFTRRDGQEADVLDFYVNGLDHRVIYWYINNDRDKAYLEHATGLVFDMLPVYTDHAAVSRVQGKPHELEQRLPRRMKIIRDPQIDKKTGQQKTFGENPQWNFNSFLGIPWESSPDKPQTVVDVPPAHITKEEYESWEVRIGLPGHTPQKLLGLMREAMAERLPELIEQNREKMMVMVPDDIEGLTLLDWLGFDIEWTMRAFKETLGYSSMYSGYRVIQAKQVVEMFAANFMFQCVELTEDDQLVNQRLMDQTVVEALEIERRHNKETAMMEETDG